MEEIDKTLSKNWAIASLGSAGVMVGVNFLEFVNLDTQRAHPAILTSAGISFALGSGSAGPVTYDRFTTSRPVSFDDFDGVGARITSVNLVAYSFGWLTIWDGPAYLSDKLAYVKMTSWGIGAPGGGSSHGVLAITYGLGVPMNMGGYQATPATIEMRGEEEVTMSYKSTAQDDPPPPPLIRFKVKPKRTPNRCRR